MRARARETSDYMARPSGICIYEKTYHRCMNGFFPYVIYFFGTHHASAPINTSKIANIRKIHEKHMSCCANVKYWRIDEQSTPTLGVKTLTPNSYLICHSNGQKMDETHFRHVSGKRGMRCVTLTPYVQSTPILILFDSAPLRDNNKFLPEMDSKRRKWIKNEASKIPYVHTSFKHQISPPIHNPREPTLNQLLFWFYFDSAHPPESYYVFTF